MALKVWLPLDGDITNHGCGDYVFSGSPNKWIENSAQFAGDTNHIIHNDTCTDLYFTQDFSFACWIKHNHTGTTHQYAFTVGRADYMTYGYGIESSSASTIRVWFGNGFQYIDCPANEWHHIACSITGTTATIYKDGIKQSSFTPVSLPTYTDARGLGIGDFHYAGDIYPYYGQIRDFRIYDNPLSSKEIRKLANGLIMHFRFANLKGGGNYNYFKSNAFTPFNGSVISKGADGVWTITSPAGISDWWGTGMSMTSGTISVPWGKSYTVSMEVLVPTKHSFGIDVNNTVASGGNWNGNDNDDSNKRIWNNNKDIPANVWTRLSWTATNSSVKNTNKVNILPFDNFGILTSSDTSTITWKVRNIQVELSNAPTAYSLPADFPIDTAYEPDSSGYLLRQGAIHGNFTYLTPSPRYNSAFYDSVGDGTNYVHVSTGLGEIAQFTITGWVYQASGGSYSTIISNSTTLGASGLWLSVNTEGHGLWAYRNGYLKYTNDPMLSTNTWYHFAYVFDNGKIIMYKNGEPVCAQTDWTAHGTTTDLNELYFFNSYTGAGWNTKFIGALSDIRLYMTTLTQSDIKEMISTPISITKTGIIMTRGEFYDD